ncbi:GNAT family N-acetyltransferase [Xanthomonas campestris]|uniref:N-acetyltransferase domain-containing protein n=1 Tax=Xanthomonas campestris pv. campestris (strain 8004) TaxID=314565 RepID=A0A0H2X7Z2_XANC8|nr:GNAT family N-acetyltransferase [Xanthomonas campestris]AAY49472.1 conserved hypothetical protein [Xanthomonas campestris pv. campestris str. 8004]MBD8246551.1 GNAT family N-acetyltransferase [Xanthomonas campestris]QCX68032.1 GNAT family N-acetyltransferase [Xanthomonas campestris pv. campestris]QCX71471.1 GNAT family N-acetyltransferase [Xanthomonas campestris pv. campestris]
MTVQLSHFDPDVTYALQKKFDCGVEVINNFVKNSLKQQVRKSLSVAYVLTDASESDKFIGFYTIAQHHIKVLPESIYSGSLPNAIPCSRLIMLGVDKGYQGKKYGSMLMKHALELTKNAARQIGSFGMYLDADPGAVNFYTSLGFHLLNGNAAPSPSPMFIPISSIA